MAEEQEPVQENELEQLEGAPLPEREVMSVISTGLDEAVPLPVDPPLRGGEQL